MQAQIEKPIETKKIKVGIVGADGTKWTKEQIPKIELEIRNIFAYYTSKILVEHGLKMGYDANKDITLVSGYCPVGEERWFCVDCDKFDDNFNKPGFVWDNLNHRFIKVFDQGGVDTLAEIIATKLGIQKEIYPAEVNQWNDEDSQTSEGWQMKPKILKGYRSRNIQIAEASDVVYCIVPETIHVSSDETTFFAEYSRNDRKHYCIHCQQFGHPTNGGCWVLEFCRQIGKESHLVVIK